MSEACNFDLIDFAYPFLCWIKRITLLHVSVCMKNVKNKCLCRTSDQSGLLRSVNVVKDFPIPLGLFH